MATRAKSPATADATAEDAEVRSAEEPAQDAEVHDAAPQPERDSLEDIVRRVQALEFRIF